MYTVKQLADISGVTPRTLRHYHKIGLLQPTEIARNGYRYYGGEALYRLQQILFYRELGMRLDKIRSILGRGDFDILAALHNHRAALLAEVKRLQRLIRTLDNTTRSLEGDANMQPKGLFEGFSDEEQEQLAAEASRRWDAQTVGDSNKRWKGYSKGEQQKILEEGKALYADLAAAMTKGAASPEVQEIVQRWRDHLGNFWTPTDEQLLGLADLYNADPRFRRNYERVAPGLAEFMREAVRVFVNGRRR
ncbi:MAG: MerR family transcriptional regulator [Anaerolineales bacterium]